MLKGYQLPGRLSSDRDATSPCTSHRGSQTVLLMPGRELDCILPACNLWRGGRGCTCVPPSASISAGRAAARGGRPRSTAMRPNPIIDHSDPQPPQRAHVPDTRCVWRRNPVSSLINLFTYPDRRVIVFVNFESLRGPRPGTAVRTERQRVRVLRLTRTRFASDM